MFNPNNIVIEAFVAHTVAEFQTLFPSPDVRQRHALEQAAGIALNSLLNCDCAYHDLEHTILVTNVGQVILKGRQIARGDLTAHDWLQGVVAMLFHDIGYLRNLLAEDSASGSVVDADGHRVSAPVGATDAFMTPYHVTRGSLYIAQRFTQDPAIDVEAVMDCIEMTRFPVPATQAYQATDTLPGLVRAADLIGQMADPQYLQKLSRLYAEFVETGEARRLGFSNAGALHSGFPEFFYDHVHPYIGAGIEYLKRTAEGHQWIANLYHHLYVNHQGLELDPKLRAPELVVSNGTIR